MTAEVEAIVAKATGKDDMVMIDSYVIIAGFQALDNEEAQVLTWHGDQPVWKTMGLLESMKMCVASDIVAKYREDD